DQRQAVEILGSAAADAHVPALGGRHADGFRKLFEYFLHERIFLATEVHRGHREKQSTGVKVLGCSVGKVCPGTTTPVCVISNFSTSKVLFYRSPCSLCPLWLMGLRNAAVRGTYLCRDARAWRRTRRSAAGWGRPCRD